MRRKIDALRESLDEFVQQDDYPLLVVGCLSEELAYVVKFLQALDPIHPQHYFVIFPQPFVTAAAYVDAVVASIRLQVDAAGPLRAQRGAPAFRSLPIALDDPRRRPAQRLEDVLRYLLALVPDHEDHRVVVGLLPLSCEDPASYAELMTTLMPVPDVPSWMDGLRIVVHDDRSCPRLLPALHASAVDQVLALEIDFSTAALADQLARDAADRTLPPGERMSCLMQLAALDYAHRRHVDALEKYAALHTFYEAQDEPSMQALALLGTGDTLRAAGRPRDAKARLQQGIAVAVQHQVLPVLLNLLLSITPLCIELRELDDAAEYAAHGVQVAAAVLNPFAQADLFELLGDAQLAQHELGDATASYQRCRELCRTYAYLHRWTSVLGRQRELYRHARLGAEQREVETELAAVREVESRGRHEAGTPA